MDANTFYELFNNEIILHIRISTTEKHNFNTME